MDLVIWPTVRGMADEGNVYTGFLYAGLMIDKAGNPKVIEFNCRFGDPETQPVMLRLQSSLVLLVEAALAQALDKVEAQWDPRPSVGIVLAAGGYPADYAKGDVIEGLDAAAVLEGKVFHAGTALEGRQGRDRRWPRTVRHRHRAPASTMPSSRPTHWPRRSTGKVASIARTSATAPLPASVAKPSNTSYPFGLGKGPGPCRTSAAPRIVNPCINLRRDFAVRWLRIAIGFTVSLLTLLCLLPAQAAAQGSGWAVLLDEQADLQLSDIRSPRYTNQFSPIELDRVTAAQPDGALWVRFKLQPGKHEQVLRIFAPDLSHLSLYVLDGDTLVEQQSTGTRQPQSERPLPQQRLHATDAPKPETS